jgi:hypothetical protein
MHNTNILKTAKKIKYLISAAKVQIKIRIGNFLRNYNSVERLHLFQIWQENKESANQI